MATQKQVTEPATAEVATVTEPAQPAATTRVYDPRKKLFVYDVNTGQKLDHPVPEPFLDGRFPQLKETPAKKEGH